MMGDKAEVTDTRVTGPEWKKMKFASPWATCPFVKVNGTSVGQTRAISGLMGTLAGIRPSDPVKAGLCDSIVNTMEDLQSSIAKCKGADARKKGFENEANVVKPYLYMQCLEDFCKKHGTPDKGFMIGDSLTTADVEIFHYLGNTTCGFFDHCRELDILKPFPNLTAVMKQVGAIPAVKAFYVKEVNAAKAKDAAALTSGAKFRYTIATDWCGLTDKDFEWASE